jgi:hypothetical protein
MKIKPSDWSFENNLFKMLKLHIIHKLNNLFQCGDVFSILFRI